MEPAARYKKRLSHILGIGLICAFLMPRTSTFLLMVNPAVCFVLWMMKRQKVISHVSLILVLSLIISLFLNFMHITAFKPLLLCLTFIMYAVFFPFVDTNVRIPIGYFYAVLGVIFISQITYLLHIDFLTRLLDTVYPITSQENLHSHIRNHVSFGNVFRYRLSGLYRNPNQCSRSVTILMMGFLLIYNERRVLPFIAISFLSVLLTGSRTGFVISAFLIVAYYFFVANTSANVRRLVVIFAIGCFIYLLFSATGVLRATDFSGTGSAQYKFKTFWYYIKSEDSFIHLLFGYLDPDRFASGLLVMDDFDADYGYLIFNYGVIGFLMILIFNLVIFFRVGIKGKTFFILLLWIFTSTIFSSYHALYMYFYVLSIVCCRHRKIYLLRGIKV